MILNRIRQTLDIEDGLIEPDRIRIVITASRRVAGAHRVGT
jgi:hypothetical protein